MGRTHRARVTAPDPDATRFAQRMGLERAAAGPRVLNEHSAAIVDCFGYDLAVGPMSGRKAFRVAQYLRAYHTHLTVLSERPGVTGAAATGLRARAAGVQAVADYFSVTDAECDALSCRVVDRETTTQEATEAFLRVLFHLPGKALGCTREFRQRFKPGPDGDTHAWLSLHRAAWGRLNRVVPPAYRTDICPLADPWRPQKGTWINTFTYTARKLPLSARAERMSEHDAHAYYDARAAILPEQVGAETDLDAPRGPTGEPDASTEPATLRKARIPPRAEAPATQQPPTKRRRRRRSTSPIPMETMLPPPESSGARRSSRERPPQQVRWDPSGDIGPQWGSRHRTEKP